MRVRTDTRRNAIVAAAWQVFRGTGYERTRMSDIAVRAHLSKATLYGYFPSKQQLFTAAVDFALSAESETAFQYLIRSDTLRDRLFNFGTSHLKVRLSPDMLAVDRIVTAEAETSHIYEAFRERSRKRRSDIADVLVFEMNNGCLRRSDPLRAAIHLIGLIEFDVRDRRLFGDTVSAAEIEEHIRDAIEAFMRAYAPHQLST